MALTGTEMSFLYGVCGAMLSEIPSRSAQSLAAWASLWLSTPSSAQPLSRQRSNARLAASNADSSNSSSA